jgi:hypothetical protein
MRWLQRDRHAGSSSGVAGYHRHCVDGGRSCCSVSTWTHGSYAERGSAAVARLAAIEEQQERDNAAIRSVARKRARLAYPELMDKDEANGHSGKDDWDPQLVDEDLIRKARESVDAEIEALEELRSDPDGAIHYGEVRSRLQHLESEAEILELIWSDPPQTDGRPAKYLQEPARIIDCALIHTRSGGGGARAVGLR